MPFNFFPFKPTAVVFCSEMKKAMKEATKQLPLSETFQVQGNIPYERLFTVMQGLFLFSCTFTSNVLHVRTDRFDSNLMHFNNDIWIHYNDQVLWIATCGEPDLGLRHYQIPLHAVARNIANNKWSQFLLVSRPFRAHTPRIELMLLMPF